MTGQTTPDKPPQFPSIGDQWEMLALIGEGGMAKVYRARHKVLNRTAAVKVLLAELVSESNYAQRFELEARALSILNHPNILRIHDYGLSPQGRAYLIVDLIEGGTLEDRIKAQGKLSPDEALPIFMQICDAVGHAHEKRIFHRDLKPSNVMLTEEANGKVVIRVVDFGLSKLRDGTVLKSLTSAGDIVGTPLYMSPEQCSGKELDERSDVYAMGCLMYAVLSGEPPFNDENVMEVLHKHYSVSPTPMVPKDAPDSPLKRLDTIARRCLAKNRDKRYQTMDDLKNDLKQVEPRSKDYWESRARHVNQLHEQPNQKRRLVVEIAVAVAILVVSFGAGLVYYHSHNKVEAVDYSNHSLWIAPSPEPVKEDPEFENKKGQAIKALAMINETPTITKGEKAEAFNRLANFYKHNGHWSDAAVWYRRAHQIFEDAENVESWDIAQTEKNLGVCQFNMGMSDDAENSLKRAVALEEKMLNDPSQPRGMLYTHPRAGELLEPRQDLESIYSRRGDLDRASQQCQEINLIYANMTGRTNDKLLWLSEAADIARRKGAWNDALNMYGVALRGWKDLKGSDSPEATKTLFALAMTAQDKGNLADSSDYMEQAMKMGTKTLPADSSLLRSMQRRQADILWKRGKFFESLRENFSG